MHIQNSFRRKFSLICVYMVDAVELVHSNQFNVDTQCDHGSETPNLLIESI